MGPSVKEGTRDALSRPGRKCSFLHHSIASFPAPGDPCEVPRDVTALWHLLNKKRAPGFVVNRRPTFVCVLLGHTGRALPKVSHM